MSSTFHEVIPGATLTLREATALMSGPPQLKQNTGNGQNRPQASFGSERLLDTLLRWRRLEDQHSPPTWRLYSSLVCRVLKFEGGDATAWQKVCLRRVRWGDVETIIVFVDEQQIL